MLLGNKDLLDKKGTDEVCGAINDLGGLMIVQKMAIGQGVAIAHALCPARAAP